MFLTRLYKRIWLPFVVFFLSISSVFSQQELIRPLPPSNQGNYTKEDSIVIAGLIETAKNHILQGIPDSSLALTDSAISLSLEKRYIEGAVNAYMQKGKTISEMGHYEEGRNIFLALLKFCTSAKGLNIYQVRLLSNIALTHQFQGNYDQSLSYYYQSLAAAEGNNVPPKNLAILYNNMATNFIKLQQPKKAIYYLELAEAIAQKEKDYDMQISALANKGMAYINQGDAVEGELYLNLVYKLSKQYGMEVHLFKAATTLGEYYLRLNLPQKAIPYFKEAQHLGQRTARKDLISLNFHTGKSYYQLHDLPTAIKYLQDALKDAEEAGMNEVSLTIHQLLATIYSEMKQPGPAYEHLDQYARMKEQVMYNRSIESSNQLEVKYRTAQKDKELIQKQYIISQQANNIKQKSLWILGVTSGIALLLVVLGGFYLMYRHKQKLHRKQIELMARQHELLQQEQHIALQEKEIDSLRANIAGEEKERERISKDLHDGIGGMLAAINMNFGAVMRRDESISKNKELNLIMQMVEETTEEVRKTAHNLMPNVLLSNTFPEALKLYCEQVSAGNMLHIDLSFYGDIQLGDKSVELLIYRMVQELIQNIIKHAQASEAIVEVTQHGEDIQLLVEDNGVGMDTDVETGKQRNGFGLQNLTYRVQALQGSISIDSEPDAGTTIIISFTLSHLHKVVASGH